MMKSTSRVKDQKAMYSSNLLSGLTLTLQDLPFNSSCCSKSNSFLPTFLAHHDMSRRFPCDLLIGLNWF